MTKQLLDWQSGRRHFSSWPKVYQNCKVAKQSKPHSLCVLPFLFVIQCKLSNTRAYVCMYIECIQPCCGRISCIGQKKWRSRQLAGYSADIYVLGNSLVRVNSSITCKMYNIIAICPGKLAITLLVDLVILSILTHRLSPCMLFACETWLSKQKLCDPW